MLNFLLQIIPMVSNCKSDGSDEFFNFLKYSFPAIDRIATELKWASFIRLIISPFAWSFDPNIERYLFVDLAPLRYLFIPKFNILNIYLLFSFEYLVCSSKDIRHSVEDFKQLEGCRVIEGFLCTTGAQGYEIYRSAED